MKKGPPPRKSLEGIPAYVPGTRSAPGFDESRMLRLASNESAWGTSPKAAKAFYKEVKNLHRYPEAGGPALRQALGRHFRVSPDQVVLGAGSNEILVLLALAYLEPGTTAIMSDMTFPIYDRATRTAGAKPIVIPSKNSRADLNAMSRALRKDTRVVFLANPNNPTGTTVSDREVRAFLRELPPTCLLVLDEAYCEFVTQKGFPDGTKLVREGKNVASVRTFSKMYGLAALRIGYGIVPAWASETLEKVRQPFNVGSPSVQAAIAALLDKGHVRKVRLAAAKGRAELLKGLRGLGFEALEGQGNFVFVAMGDPSAIALFLLKSGIAVRGIPGAGLRVTVGRSHENQKVLAAIQRWKGFQ